MPRKLVSDLCTSEFLNLNQTWYTEKPFFSECFRDTFLIWVPACFFILVISNEYANILGSNSKRIPWNVFNRLRILSTIFLFLVKACESIILVASIARDISPSESGSNPVSISELAAPLIQETSYLILGIIYYYQRRAGLHTSRTIWFYLLISLLCGSLDLYSTSVTPVAQPNYLDEIKRVLRYIYQVGLIWLFILECRGDSAIIERDPTKQDDVRPDSPELTSSFFSSITFWWYSSFLLFGYKSKLRLIDLWRTLPRDKASELVPIFRETWLNYVDRTKKLKNKVYYLTTGELQPFNGMLSTLFKLFWRKLLFAASLKFVQDSLQFITPLILKRLLSFMSSPDAPTWQGVLFASMLLILPTIQSVTLGNYFYNMQLIGLHMRTMIIGSVYRKALLLSGSSRLQSTSGEIVNLMSVDSQRFQDLLMYVNLIWSAPFQIMLAITLLYRELGWPIFAGVICMALVMPGNAYLANRIKFSQIRVMKIKDERVKQINEVLSGIKVIKLYAWENSFISNLYSFRNRELNYLNRILNLDALQTFLWQCSPFAVACVSFAVYVNASPDNVLNAEKAFVSISLFNLLRFPLTMLPSLVTSLVLTMVSARRLSNFLNSNELVRYVTRNEELEAVSIEGGTLSWSAGDEDNEQQDSKDKEKERPQLTRKEAILKDINLHVKPKSFVAIVGQVASGKSSLLSAILGEMHRIAGRFNVCKSLKIAYVPQQAWIQNMTVQDNITFSSNLDPELYEKVLSACSLKADLENLPGGDQAEIGEKGINLSGGQKQRVSLARACYSNSDLYLLDDPLSALDSHVAKHVFDQVLSSSTGLLKDKTRILATNALFVLPYVDHIVVLDAGRVVESGTYQELTSNKGGYLAEFMRQYSVNEKEDETSEGFVKLGPKDLVEDKKLSLADGLLGNKVAKETLATADATALKSNLTAVKSDIGKLIDIEKVELGSVDHQVYLHYFRSASFTWLSLMALSMFGSSSFQVATNLWLSIWAADAEDPNKAKDGDLRFLRLMTYAVLGGLQAFTVLSSSLALTRGAIRAAKILHKGLLEGVMHSPMNFFDTTPIGRIVNRFAKDIDVVDSTLPGAFKGWFNCFLQVISTMFVICYSFPTFVLIILPLGVVYYLIQKIFIVTTRQLKRLESTTRSPIYSNFNETLSGISTIRAYECVDRFVNYSDDLVDRNQSCSYPNIIANRWLSVRLEFFGNLITSSAALFSVYYKGTIGAGVAGLTISYSLSITQTLSWLVRMTSDLETNIVSVERILEYIQNKQEDRWIKEENRPHLTWPDEGEIIIDDYSTRYRDDTDLVLKHISLSIKPREKIGIVGRTGSGKSSLSLALFRILEPASGSITIDKLNICQYGLHDIRSKLTIIPQDPVLFSGSLRFNLDPLRLYPDMDIWRSLELAHLKQSISGLEDGLDHQVSEYGENFSVGQRQLICLARAILRKSKILVLDEATASVDLETDSIVQRTIREIFKDCTIITIAHRLHTILDSDRILVLDSGKVLELDSPVELMSNEKSAFASLVRDAGLDTNSIMRYKKAQLPS